MKSTIYLTHMHSKFICSSSKELSSHNEFTSFKLVKAAICFLSAMNGSLLGTKKGLWYNRLRQYSQQLKKLLCSALLHSIII